MTTVNSLISQRLKKNSSSNKMTVMAELSAKGDRSSFSGIFQVSELSESEKKKLEELLKNHSVAPETLFSDLEALIAITKEVKALNHQAALLHGERIKRVRELLKTYRTGAFSAWLTETYGNRQTPYNLLQYFEFWEKMPKALQSTLEKIPRQAVYTLASREAPLELKKAFIEEFKGETKQELLEKIRQKFPLKEEDLRKADIAQKAIYALRIALKALSNPECALKKGSKQEILGLLTQIKGAVYDRNG